MRAVDIIRKKRDGSELSAQEIDSFVQGVTRGEIPDYQAAAWLMAIVCRGMSDRETVDLTISMVESGETLDLSSIAPWVVDKHSSGGVGDKTTLVVAPIVAAWGMPVAKMSGRGLSFTGGTLDKMESLRGYRVDLTQAEFLDNLARHGIVLSGQTASLAPADGKLYALRDVTGTVESIPLIASSIMSKKIAAGANAIVLDVKVGAGAFMRDLKSAAELAEAMIQIGRGAGRRVTVALSAMDQPLGSAVGNAIEVIEAIDTLNGGGPDDFREHCEDIAAEMLILGKKCVNEAQGREMARQALRDGRAMRKFEALVAAQGGDVAQVRDPRLLPTAPVIRDLPSPRRGYVAGIDARTVGMAALDLGAGRARKGDPVDHAVGIVLRKKVGDSTAEGEPLLTLHARRESDIDPVGQRLLSAYSWSDQAPSPTPLIYRIMRD